MIHSTGKISRYNMVDNCYDDIKGNNKGYILTMNKNLHFHFF